MSPWLCRLVTSYWPLVDLNGLLESKLSTDPPPLIETQLFRVTPRAHPLVESGCMTTSIVRVACGTPTLVSCFRSNRSPTEFRRSLSSRLLVDRTYPPPAVPA